MNVTSIKKSDFQSTKDKVVAEPEYLNDSYHKNEDIELMVEEQ